MEQDRPQKPTFAEQIIDFNAGIEYSGSLPKGIHIMNPFRDNPYAFPTSSDFYRKYYNDRHKRRLILGINPGRHGAGLTGVPFTDAKRLDAFCGIPFAGPITHEPSSVFVYEVIKAFGGPERFYRHFYIHSVCPLGFTADSASGKVVNYNYYDSPALLAAVGDFIKENLHKQVSMPVYTDACICFGTGKNEKYLSALNSELGLFGKIIALEHPRFIMQYKSKDMQQYIQKYLDTLEDLVDAGGD